MLAVPFELWIVRWKVNANTLLLFILTVFLNLVPQNETHFNTFSPLFLSSPPRFLPPLLSLLHLSSHLATQMK